MLLNYKVKGFKVFNEEVNISYDANKKIKNKDYVFDINNNQILKSAIIYGPNNTGKSTIIESLDLLKKIVLDGVIINSAGSLFDYNYFNEKKEISYEIEFLSNSENYNYKLSFEYEKGITNESLSINNKLIFDRNKKNDVKELNDVIELFVSYKDKLIISTLPKNYKKYTETINNFFQSMIIIRGHFNFNDVINEITDLTEKEFKKFSRILKSADISINNIVINNELKSDSYKPLKLFSEYIMNNKKVSFPSIISDSNGTRIFMLYILKIIKIMRKGGILVIDEIDSSLHTLLTKSIITIFNSFENRNIQLLATSHDLLLLDCLYLFRKDQIWFTYKDNEKVYLYSLDNFKSNIDNQIRNKTMESYLKGLFGALPHPNIEEYIFYE